jgi:hypothetical protein
MKKTILLFVFTLSINTVFADSPLTSTNFYQAYLDVQAAAAEVAEVDRMVQTMLVVALAAVVQLVMLEILVMEVMVVLVED